MVAELRDWLGRTVDATVLILDLLDAGSLERLVELFISKSALVKNDFIKEHVAE